VPTPVQPDFNNLMTVWQAVAPSSTPMAAAVTPPAIACPGYTQSLWEVSGNVPLPTIGAAAVAVAPTSGATAIATVTATATASRAASGAATTATVASAASASASTTKTGGAEGRKEIAGVALGLTGVLFGAMYWL